MARQLRLVSDAGASKSASPEESKKRLHTKLVGDQTQAFVIAHLLPVYPVILLPYGENQRYDLVIDDEGRFLRVQCKTGRLKNGAIIWNACSYTYHHPVNRGTVHYQQDYRGQADLFGIYCSANGKVYLVPVDEVGKRGGSLRIDAPRNNQTKKIRWASDYEVRPG
ncbi:MAG: group I intron-associated PD-(D/E)XK endonuclease [Actinomycetota bacterium]